MTNSVHTNLNIDSEKARFNMVEQQIRTWDVFDSRVLDLLAQVPREQFVGADHKALAFADVRLPLGDGHDMLCPREEARLLQALNVQTGESALVIGTGSGYITALLAHMARHVYSVDIVPAFVHAASARLQALDLGAKVTLEVGDAANGWDHYGPYDVIAVTGSLETVSDNLKRSLKIGGRLFVIVGRGHAMTAKLITRSAEQEWQEENLFDTVVPRLINAPTAAAFAF